MYPIHDVGCVVIQREPFFGALFTQETSQLMALGHHTKHLAQTLFFTFFHLQVTRRLLHTAQHCRWRITSRCTHSLGRGNPSKCTLLVHLPLASRCAGEKHAEHDERRADRQHGRPLATRLAARLTHWRWRRRAARHGTVRGPFPRPLPDSARRRARQPRFPERPLEGATV